MQISLIFDSITSVAWKCNPWHVNLYFKQSKTKCKGKLNFEGLEMQKSNIPTDRAWRVYEKTGVIFLVIMFALGVIVIKMLKNGSFFVFFADDRKILVTV